MKKPLKQKINALAETVSFLSDETLKRDNLILLMSIFLFAVVYPVIPNKNLQEWTFAILVSAIVIAGVTSLKFEKEKFVRLTYFGYLTLFTIWLDHFISNELTRLSAFVILIMFIIYITYSMIVHVTNSNKVNSIMILNAINSYLMIGIIAAFLFATLNIIYQRYMTLPDATIFNGAADPQIHDFIYFSFVTLTTLGYGDITPAIPAARSLAIIVSIIGQLYLTILVAVLVGKYISQHKDELPKNKDNS